MGSKKRRLTSFPNDADVSSLAGGLVDRKEGLFLGIDSPDGGLLGQPPSGGPDAANVRDVFVRAVRRRLSDAGDLDFFHGDFLICCFDTPRG